MERKRKLGLAGAILALALIIGGCGVHAGFHIGKSPAPGTAQANQDAEAGRS